MDFRLSEETACQVELSVRLPNPAGVESETFFADMPASAATSLVEALYDHLDKEATVGVELTVTGKPADAMAHTARRNVRGLVSDAAAHSLRGIMMKQPPTVGAQQPRGGNKRGNSKRQR